MKMKVTFKEVRRNHRLFALGYGAVQYLMFGNQPIAYNSGVYGWNCDFYALDKDGETIMVCTGYRPRGWNVSYDITNKYEQMAREVCDSYIDYGEKIAKVAKIRDEWISKVF